METDRRGFLFGITVSELGFILFFLLLILAFFDISEREAAFEAIESARADEQAVLSQLQRSLDAGREVDLDEIFVELTRARESQRQLDALRQEYSQLVEASAQDQAALEEYESLAAAIETLGIPGGDPAAKARSLRERLASQAKLQELMAEQGKENADLAQTMASLLRERDDAEGRLQNILNRRGRGGLDLPPCWPSTDGSPEFTFDVNLGDRGSVTVRQSAEMPAYRASDFQALPSIPDILERTLRLREFRGLAQPIYRLGQSNQCVYYVRIEADTVEGCLLIGAIEEYFYKYLPPSEARECADSSARSATSEIERRDTGSSVR